MKLKILFSTMILILPASMAWAQHEHSDVELGYDNLSSPSAFLIEQDNMTSDGFQIFEAAFEELDPFSPGDFSSDEPGFATNPAEGLVLNSGDQIWLRAIDAQLHSGFGVGFVNYYNPMTDTLEASGRLAILDNSVGTPDLILNGGAVESGNVFQFIDAANGDGEIHDHVVIDLLDDGSAPLGAYGIMFELQSDFDSPDGTMDLTSDPFWIVWNHGMDEAEFEATALPTFGFSAVPEPGSATVLITLAAISLVKRRRRTSI